MLIYSNSSKSENSCKLFNLNDLLIQPMDYEEGFQTKDAWDRRPYLGWLLAGDGFV